jgi:hypothetical protein
MNDFQVTRFLGRNICQAFTHDQEYALRILVWEI